MVVVVVMMMMMMMMMMMLIVEDTIILNIFQVIASLFYVVAPDQRQAIT